jgi:hypothetical protein
MKIRVCSKSKEMDPFQFTVDHGKSIGEEDQVFLDLASGIQSE